VVPEPTHSSSSGATGSTCLAILPTASIGSSLTALFGREVEALIENAEESNEGVTITLAPGTEVTISGLTLAQLDISDFNF